jgi:hypothetical protein
MIFCCFLPPAIRMGFARIIRNFAAVLAWLLGRLPAEILARVRGVAWALAACFVAITEV